MDDVFLRRLWHSAPQPLGKMPRGMLGPIEGALLYYLARDYFKGYGDIIDAGAFIGSSSYCLSKGLEENPGIRSKSGRIHAYDYFALWLEQEATDQFMASELKRIFGIELAGGESTLHLYMANLGALARHIQIYRGDITTMAWGARPIEILFLDICKSLPVWRHVLKMFYPSLIPGVSLVVHQDYHHPLLPFIHVAQEKLAPYFEIAEVKADDSAVFRLVDRIPERMIDEVVAYEFDFPTQIKLMDGAIERLPGNNQHLRIAKAQLLRQQGRTAQARKLLDELYGEIPDFAADPKFASYIAFVNHRLTGDEAREMPPSSEFDEESYLKAYPDVGKAVAIGTFDSGLHHWLAFGKAEKRALHNGVWTIPKPVPAAKIPPAAATPSPAPGKARRNWLDGGNAG